MAGLETTQHQFGLRCIKTKSAVCLKEINVSVRITGFIADVESCLVYENKEKEAIETDFIFPVDDKSAVYKFQAEIDGRTITAECQAKEQARETYKDAIDSGHTAMLLSEDDVSGDVFQMKLGNLPPDTEAKLTISYVLELTLGPDGIFTYTLPTVLNPRYSPQGSPESLANSATTYSKYDFSFTSSIEGEHAIKSVTSTKDKMDVTIATDKKSASITLADKFSFDHDLSFDIEYEDTSNPTVTLERGSPEYSDMMKLDCLMLNFLPDFKASQDQSDAEFIIVIDRSGSMRGRIKQASETLLLLLKSLPVGCTFNIISFGSSFSKLFESPLVYDKKSLETALDLQKSIKADMGGTEILPLLKDVYKKKPTTTRQLFLLTDGSVSNTQDVINICKKNAGNTRVFSFGIGSGSSSSLINGVANATGGKATFVQNNDRLQSMVMTVLRCAMQPAITDLELTWKMPGDCKVINIPSEIPPVFKGEHLIVYAILQDFKQENEETSATLSGKIGKEVINHSVTFDLCQSGKQSGENYLVHRLAAKAQIKRMELDEESFNSLKQAMVTVSTSANVISKHTAFIGVDKEGKDMTNGIGLPDSLNQPNLLYLGANLKSCGLMDAGETFCCSASPMMFESSARKSSKRSSSVIPSVNLFGGIRDAYSGLKRKILGSGRERGRSLAINDTVVERSLSFDTGPHSSAAPNSVKGGMMGIIDLQQFDGSWHLTEDLATILSMSIKRLQDSNPGLVSNVWATVIALAYLQENFMDKNSEWQMIESKAMKWLTQQSTDGKDISDLLQTAKRIIAV